LAAAEYGRIKHPEAARRESVPSRRKIAAKKVTSTYGRAMNTELRAVVWRESSLEHQGSSKTWWLFEPRELYNETRGGHLESIRELEVPATGRLGASNDQHTYEFLYVTFGRGRIKADKTTRELVPGDLILLRPDTSWTLSPLASNTPAHCLSFGFRIPDKTERVSPAVSTETSLSHQTGMDVRSIHTVPPEVLPGTEAIVWWLYRPHEIRNPTHGGHVELFCEFEIAGGAKINPHKHPTWEFYYPVFGRGSMTIGEHTREIVPGDLTCIPPNQVHTVSPISKYAPVRILTVAFGIEGGSPYDYTND
jgi:quercetin dioxygenase-like cupin family protein